MAKLMTFAMIATVMMALFTIFNFDSSIETMINLFQDLDNFQSGGLFSNVQYYLGLMAAAGVAAAFIGIFGRGSTLDSFYAAGLAAYLTLFIYDFINIVTYSKSICAYDSPCGWISYLVTIIVGTIVVGFTISLFDWARGND